MAGSTVKSSHVGESLVSVLSNLSLEDGMAAAARLTIVQTRLTGGPALDSENGVGVEVIRDGEAQPGDKTVRLEPGWGGID